MTIPNLPSEVVRGPLSDCSAQFKNHDFIADQVFPIKDGVSSSAKYTKYSRGAWFRDEAKIRAAGTQAARGGFGIEYVNINPVQYAFGKEVTEEDVEAEGMQGAPPINMQQDAIEYAANKVDLKKEIRVANIVQTTNWNGLGAGGQDAGGLWSADTAAASNTFFIDVRAGRKKICQANHLVAAGTSRYVFWPSNDERHPVASFPNVAFVPAIRSTRHVSGLDQIRPPGKR